MQQFAITPDDAAALRFGIEDLPEAAFVVDAAHNILSINAAALKLIGFSREEVVGWSLEKLFPRQPKGFSQLFAGTGGMTKFEIRMNTKSGTPAFMSFMAMPVRKDGRVVAVTYLGRDVRLRKLVEGEIRKARDYFRAIIQDAPNGICITDLSRNVVMINKVAEDLTGYSADEIIGTSVTAFYPAAAATRTIDVEALRRGEKISHEIELTHRDGSTTPALVLYRLLEDEHGEQMIIESYSDLSDRKRLDRLRNEFVFIAAHELRNPVSAIRLLLNIIYDDRRTHVDAVMREYLLKIQEADERLLQLVDDLLEVSRNESGRLKIVVSPQNVSEHIEAIFNELRPTALAKEVQLVYEPLHSMPLVMADPSKLKEVISNLVSNGIKYNSVGGELTVRHALRDGFLETIVADNGIGISEADRGKLFEKFWRSEDKAVRAQAGTGLGLYIVKELVERMGGRISVESAGGRGTTFTFTLPLAKKT